MEWGISIADVGQGLLYLILALLGAIGVNRGLRQQAKPEKMAEIVGGIVDNSAIDRLTNELAQGHRQHRENRKLMHETIEAIDRLTKELSEIRNEMRFKRN